MKHLPGRIAHYDLRSGWIAGDRERNRLLARKGGAIGEHKDGK
jgi:hypothetical protein